MCSNLFSEEEFKKEIDALNRSIALWKARKKLHQIKTYRFPHDYINTRQNITSVKREYDCVFFDEFALRNNKKEELSMEEKERLLEEFIKKNDIKATKDGKLELYILDQQEESHYQTGKVYCGNMSVTTFKQTSIDLVAASLSVLPQPSISIVNYLKYIPRKILKVLVDKNNINNIYQYNYNLSVSEFEVIEEVKLTPEITYTLQEVNLDSDEQEMIILLEEKVTGKSYDICLTYKEELLKETNLHIAVLDYLKRDHEATELKNKVHQKPLKLNV